MRSKIFHGPKSSFSWQNSFLYTKFCFAITKFVFVRTEFIFVNDICKCGLISMDNCPLLPNLQSQFCETNIDFFHDESHFCYDRGERCPLRDDFA